MHDIYKQKCLVKSIYLVLQIKHCKKVRSSIGFKRHEKVLISHICIELSLKFSNWFSLLE